MKSQAHTTNTMQEEAMHEAERYMHTIVERCKTSFAHLGHHLQVTSSVITNADVVGTIIKETEQYEQAK